MVRKFLVVHEQIIPDQNSDRILKQEGQHPLTGQRAPPISLCANQF